MYAYQNPRPAQLTNIRNNTNTKELLSAGGSVHILALPDSALSLLNYGSFHLNLAAGPEDDILHQLNPIWNKADTTPSLALRKSLHRFMRRCRKVLFFYRPNFVRSAFYGGAVSCYSIGARYIEGLGGACP